MHAPVFDAVEFAVKALAAIIGTAFIAGFFSCLFLTVVRR